MLKFKIDDDVKAIIFDCDGTLADSMPLHMEAWKNTLRNRNIYYDEHFLFSLKGMKETEIVALYNKKFGTKLDSLKIVSEKHEYLKQHIAGIKPIKDVVDVAIKYYDIIPLAVVSGSGREIVEAELKSLGIINLFKVILTADDPYKPKPSPEIFIKAANLINTKPASCLVFEDGDHGLIAAGEAGMKTIDVRKYL